jgi:ABC-type uncharacterized transport system permease subunit
MNNEMEAGTGAVNANVGNSDADGRLLAKIMGMVAISIALSMLSGFIADKLGIDYAIVFLIVMFFSLGATCFILSRDKSK